MHILRDDWVVTFNKIKNLIPSNTSVVNIFCDSKTVIDDTVIYSNHITILLHYFPCVAKILNEYYLSFKLSKCPLFLLCTEYVGDNLTADGNSPTQFKFQLIKE